MDTSTNHSASRRREKIFSLVLLSALTFFVNIGYVIHTVAVSITTPEHESNIDLPSHLEKVDLAIFAGFILIAQPDSTRAIVRALTKTLQLIVKLLRKTQKAWQKHRRTVARRPGELGDEAHLAKLDNYDRLLRSEFNLNNEQPAENVETGEVPTQD